MDRKNFNLCLKFSGLITLVILLGFLIVYVIRSPQSAKGDGLVSSSAPLARGPLEGESEKDNFLDYLKKPMVFTSAWFRQLVKDKPHLSQDPSLSSVLASMSSSVVTVSPLVPSMSSTLPPPLSGTHPQTQVMSTTSVKEPWRCWKDLKRIVSELIMKLIHSESDLENRVRINSLWYIFFSINWCNLKYTCLIYRLLLHNFFWWKNHKIGCVGWFIICNCYF